MAVTYTSDEPISGPTFTCKRCTRVYPHPKAGDRPLRCECGWVYTYDNGAIHEAFMPRIGGADKRALG